VGCTPGISKRRRYPPFFPGNCADGWYRQVCENYWHRFPRQTDETLKTQQFSIKLPTPNCRQPRRVNPVNRNYTHLKTNLHSFIAPRLLPVSQYFW